MSELGERNVRAVVHAAVDEYAGMTKPDWIHKPMVDALQALPRRARMNLADYIADRAITSLGLDPKEPCGCGCGCEPDGAWHHGEKFCMCLQLQCECIMHVTGKAAALLLCAVPGALRRYGPMNSFQIAARLGQSALLVERALCTLKEEGQVAHAEQKWRIVESQEAEQAEPGGAAPQP